MRLQGMPGRDILFVFYGLGLKQRQILEVPINIGSSPVGRSGMKTHF
jgi:hypothetical protein